ncbi:protein CHROMATIN REMODELING 20 isoform X1 [Arachis duranensis]|uniref:ATP-dependent helicase ATRX n=4 Tax=Arachis TaxID=3817 RepID=A0A6P4BCY8_ARADU|nr:protein CHROMATIN REMODELING 20 isoform X1 [Arachis duranensis]XP_025619166.1 protein CHROMATIN REMODELING 20 isoform X1 [Arachis hypogaea]XP_052109536.1 protein CHROMATIN REMODELING 20 isoform X1 [Arachis duranensis]QHO34705.1 Protein CHROMATIN REMODELING [Arachis hypogaea]
MTLDLETVIHFSYSCSVGFLPIVKTTALEMEGKTEDEVVDIESGSSGSFNDDSDDEGSLPPEVDDDRVNLEEPLTEEEIQDLISELLEVESKAAEAQEALEEESLAKVESDVRQELQQTLTEDDLETAVADEMATFKEEWETVLDDLETESANLLEQLDGAGIELPSLYKWIEKEAPNGCRTEAWKKRNHWVGLQATTEIAESVADAEKYLQVNRPVRRRHGKLLEEGASGFLQKKIGDETKDPVKKGMEGDWDLFNKIVSDGSGTDVSFGSKHWASVYLASTPQQAALMGLKFPGVNEVEEIDDVDGNSADPFVAAAIANERELDLSEEQKRQFKKVKEEDDAIVDRKLQIHLKQRRRRKKSKQNDKLEDFDAGYDLEKDNAMSTGDLADPPKSLLDDIIEQRGTKRLNDGELDTDNKKSRTISDDSDDDTDAIEDKVDRNMSTLEEKGLLNSGADTLPSVCPNEKFHCTICHQVALEVHSHPLLKVIICGDCNCLMEEKICRKDLSLDSPSSHCAWCGGSSGLINCKSCTMLFCTNCIKKNLGAESLTKAQATGWDCCFCQPNSLQRLTLLLEKAMGSTAELVSSSSSDSENSDDSDDSDESDAEINATISSKRRRKKKIRRILDDTELGEETKKKIAIEKERQERLKSLRGQFSASPNEMSSSNLSEGASVEVLGDAASGYIVNVVREKGEEAVRIPPSISAKLKAHQIAGIRFMWENIVESIRKVKSGDKGLGCILAHTMGLGKTFQVIAFLYTAMRCVDLGLRTALIVTPVNVLHNWRQEFIKWKPSELKQLRVFMLEDVPRDRRVELLAKWRTKGGVFLIGYTAFRNLSFGKHVKDRNVAREICHALQDGPDILVCDEAHMIKNTRADVTHALKQVKCQRRIALTGSPLQNNLMEYYCMVDFVREGFLGSSHEFRNRFQNPIENGQHTNSTLTDVKIMNQRSHILYEQLKGFVQRMDMTVVKKDLPPKTVFVVTVKLSLLQRKLYKRFLDVHGFSKDSAHEKFGKRCFFAGYQALARIWNHPGILQLTKEDKDYVRQEEAVENFIVDDCSSDDNSDINAVGEKMRYANDLPQKKDGTGFFVKGWWHDLLPGKIYREPDHGGKMVLLLEILTISSSVGDKVLVFSQSIPTLDLIELYLSKIPRHGKPGKRWKKGKDWYRLDGRTESSERQRIVERFNEPSNKRVKCTLISTRAGSLGINLHSANRVVIIDGSWNPTYDLQAIYRAWRYGQTKPVFAYRLLAHGTMEEKIYKRQVTKEGLAARVVDRQQVHRTISKEEMLHLFEFGDDENPETLAELNQENGSSSNTVKHTTPHSNGSSNSDKLMESLLKNHQPRWIANYHEHETLLQENEEEKLSKEEKDMAWEVYKKSLEWEEVGRVPISDPMPDQKAEMAASSKLQQVKDPLSMVSSSRIRNRFNMRKCTNLAHMLTLRSQRIKQGGCTVCGECAQEIRWDDLKITK